jgi:hypothetical protein
MQDSQGREELRLAMSQISTVDILMSATVAVSHPVAGTMAATAVMAIQSIPGLHRPLTVDDMNKSNVTVLH